MGRNTSRCRRSEFTKKECSERLAAVLPHNIRHSWNGSGRGGGYLRKDGMGAPPVRAIVVAADVSLAESLILKLNGSIETRGCNGNIVAIGPSTISTRIWTFVRAVGTEKIPSRTIGGHIKHPPGFLRATFEPRTGERTRPQNGRLALDRQRGGGSLSLGPRIRPLTSRSHVTRALLQQCSH